MLNALNLGINNKMLEIILTKEKLSIAMWPEVTTNDKMKPYLSDGWQVTYVFPTFLFHFVILLPTQSQLLSLWDVWSPSFDRQMQHSSFCKRFFDEAIKRLLDPYWKVLNGVFNSNPFYLWCFLLHEGSRLNSIKSLNYDKTPELEFPYVPIGTIKSSKTKSGRQSDWNKSNKNWKL